MILKFLFDRIVALIGLLFLWPLLIVVAVLVKIKMPDGSVIFTQKRVGKDGKRFGGFHNAMCNGCRFSRFEMSHREIPF